MLKTLPAAQTFKEKAVFEFCIETVYRKRRMVKYILARDYEDTALYTGLLDQ